MIVINSAAYVEMEFRNELGAIPPCFLPLGNQKLLEHQVNSLKKFKNQPIVVSLPASYDLTLDEHNLLESLQVEVVVAPDDFSLAESLTYVLNLVASDDGSLRLLHGDTLILDLPEKLDVISIGKPRGDYNWEVEVEKDAFSDDLLVWSGFFSFSSQRALLRALALSRGNFVAAIRTYIDSMSVETVVSKKWFDLGHINTYFLSRSEITTQRSFNKLFIDDGVLYKTGDPAKKIQAEAEWFKNIPVRMRKYTPYLIDFYITDKREPFYALEYLPNLPLNELFVHGRNTINFWEKRFVSIQGFLKDARQAYDVSQPTLIDLNGEAEILYRDKTFDRLRDYTNQSGVSFDLSIAKISERTLTIGMIVDECVEKTLSLPIVPAVLHGDLCLSNILFDSRTGRIKVVDPRGLNFKGDFSIYGDQKYDLAKLAHSVIGLYDFIIAGRYSIGVDIYGYEYIFFELDERFKKIQYEFININFLEKISFNDIIPLVILLFLSMLPLHSDRPDRQKAMLLNAVRMYRDYIFLRE